MISDKVVVEERKQLRDYELVLVISPDIEEDKFEATIDNVSQLIIGKGDIISGVERWGKKRLAYPIRHFVEGNYVLLKMKMKPTSAKELEANLQISEEVLRHLLVKQGS